MKILSNKKYRELVLKSCRGMFGAVTDDMLLRSNGALSKEIDELKERIGKAVEYINNDEDLCYYSRCDVGDLLIEVEKEFKNDLLNILNGSDEDENE